jgi:hypothetical protein
VQIRQIQTRHDEVQDRILLRVSTSDDCEFQFWLTRRFLKRFWPLLLKMLEQDDMVRGQVHEEARRAVVGMRHEEFVQRGDFATAFEERQYQRPLGTEPVLVGRADCTPRGNGIVVLALRPMQGQGIELTLDARLLHSICKLLGDAIAKADWNIELKSLQGETAADAAQAPRTIN